MDRPSTSSYRRKRCEEETMQSWSDLPEGPLHTILMCLCSILDLISFSSVCRSWRAVASQNASFFPPLLLYPTCTRSRFISTIRFLDPTTPFFFSTLPRNSNKFASVHFFSFSHGHLLGLSQNRVVIVNPFTGHDLSSPYLPDDYDISLNSIMLTSPLPSLDSGILLYASGCLCYWRIGLPLWSCHYFQTFQPGDRMTVVTMQGKFYAMDSLDTLYELELSPKLHLRPLAVEGLASVSFSIWHSIVDCGGELLRLQLVPNEEVISSHLEAFRLDVSANKMSWVKKGTLGNWAIFVGCNRRTPGIVVENPERWGGRNNRVYFATRNANGGSPWVVIKLGDRIDTWDRDSPLFIGSFGQQLSSAWVRPNF